MGELTEPQINKLANVGDDIDQTEESGASAIMTEEQIEEDQEKESKCRRLFDFYSKNEFMILVVLAILLAKAYPPLGAEYLAEEITAAWVAVILIFFLAGLGLNTSEFSKAFKLLGFNVAVQTFNFGVISAIVFGVSRAFLALNVIPESLADGLVICASLPLSISMVAVLTKSAGGDEASAVFHAAFGNFLGVFLSPALILGYLGVSGSIDMGKVLYQLILRVIVPVILGQILQKCSPSIVAFSNKYKRVITSVKEYALVFIIYTIFCQTFANDTNDSDLGDVFIMIAIIFFLLSGFMIMSWLIFRFLYRDEPKLRVMALYGTTHKTISIGIPLISAMYEGDPRIALYSLPLLIWYIMQLVLGTLIAPKLRDWVQTEQKRLGRVDELEAESDEESPAPSVNEESPEDDLETSQTN